MPATLDRPRPAADLFDEVRRIIAPRRHLPLAEWAERYRRVTAGPLIGPGGAATRWSNELFPLQRGIMEAIDDRRWSAVVVMGPPQAGGKTECAAVNPALRAIHRQHRDVLYMSANQLKAESQWVKKFEPAIRASPDLAPLIPENRDDAGDKNQRDFTNGTSLYLAGSESVANLSASTISVVICDDVQAMPDKIGGLGHPVDIAYKRAFSFPPSERLLIALGTASVSGAYLQRLLDGSTLFRPLLPCPRCSHYQLLEWERMEFDAADPVAARGGCRLKCAACAALIERNELPIMLRRVRWAAAGQSVSADGTVSGEGPRSTVAGFWFSALYWPFSDWASLAASWVEGRGDPDRERDFQQHVLVRPWTPPDPDREALTVEALGGHITRGHRWGVIPAEADTLTVTADVHDRFLYYIVRAWRKECGTSWLIDAGTLGVHGPRKDERLTATEREARLAAAIRQALDDLWATDREGWVIEGRSERAHAVIVIIDGGYRPDAVGQFCLLRNAGLGYRKWHMIHGKSGSGKGVLPIWPLKVQTNRRGHVYREVNVDEAKHVLREQLAAPSGQPGGWRTYDDRPLETYHRHLVSEHFVERTRSGRSVMRWEKREGAGPNHWWDCEVYQIAAAVAVGVRLGGGPPAAQTADGGARKKISRRLPDGRPFLVSER